jgi:hypothetical protein
MSRARARAQTDLVGSDDALLQGHVRGILDALDRIQVLQVVLEAQEAVRGRRHLGGRGRKKKEDVFFFFCVVVLLCLFLLGVSMDSTAELSLLAHVLSPDPQGSPPYALAHRPSPLPKQTTLALFSVCWLQKC